MYVLYLGDRSVYEHDLSTPWDVSTGSYSGKVLTDIGTKAGNNNKIPFSIDFNATGTEVFFMAETREFLQFSLSTAWDISTATHTLTKDVDVAGLGTGTVRAGEVDEGGQYFMWMVANSDPRRMYSLYSAAVNAVPYSQYIPTVTGTTGQINTSAWTDIDSMVADETKNGGDVFYAVSTDNKTSWGVIKDGSGVRKIAKNNSGTWQYNNDAGSSTIAGYDLSNSSSLNKTLSSLDHCFLGLYLNLFKTDCAFAKDTLNGLSIIYLIPKYYISIIFEYDNTYVQ